MSGYLDRGELLEIHGADGMIGVVVLVREADEVEIWNIALAEDYRGRGPGGWPSGPRRSMRERRLARPSAPPTAASARSPSTGRRASGRRRRQGYFDSYPMAVVENGIRARTW